MLLLVRREVFGRRFTNYSLSNQNLSNVQENVVLRITREHISHKTLRNAHWKTTAGFSKCNSIYIMESQGGVVVLELVLDLEDQSSNPCLATKLPGWP